MNDNAILSVTTAAAVAVPTSASACAALNPLPLYRAVLRLARRLVSMLEILQTSHTSQCNLHRRSPGESDHTAPATLVLLGLRRVASILEAVLVGFGLPLPGLALPASTSISSAATSHASASSSRTTISASGSLQAQFQSALSHTGHLGDADADARGQLGQGSLDHGTYSTSRQGMDSRLAIINGALKVPRLTDGDIQTTWSALASTGGSHMLKNEAHKTSVSLDIIADTLLFGNAALRLLLLGADNADSVGDGAAFIDALVGRIVHIMRIVVMGTSQYGIDYNRSLSTSSTSSHVSGLGRDLSQYQPIAPEVLTALESLLSSSDSLLNNEQPQQRISAAWNGSGGGGRSRSSSGSKSRDSTAVLLLRWRPVVDVQQPHHFDGPAAFVKHPSAALAMSSSVGFAPGRVSLATLHHVVPLLGALLAHKRYALYLQLFIV